MWKSGKHNEKQLCVEVEVKLNPSERAKPDLITVRLIDDWLKKNGMEDGSMDEGTGKGREMKGKEGISIALLSSIR